MAIEILDYVAIRHDGIKRYLSINRFELYAFGVWTKILPSAPISANTSNRTHSSWISTLQFSSSSDRDTFAWTHCCFLKSLPISMVQEMGENGCSLASTGHCRHACSSGLRNRRGPCHLKPGSPGTKEQSRRLAICEIWYAEEEAHSGGHARGWLSPIDRVWSRLDEQAPSQKRIWPDSQQKLSSNVQETREKVWFLSVVSLFSLGWVV